MSADLKALAEFVEEGLAGLGILDDADEIIAWRKGTVFRLDQQRTGRKDW